MAECPYDCGMCDCKPTLAYALADNAEAVARLEEPKYCFMHDGFRIHDPFMSECGRFWLNDPLTYYGQPLRDMLVHNGWTEDEFNELYDDVLNDMVAKAERAAGWDPNP